MLSLCCRFSQAALRKMYKVLLGQMEPPDEATPSFIEEEMPEVGTAQQKALAHRQLLKVGRLSRQLW